MVHSFFHLGSEIIESDMVVVVADDIGLLDTEASRLEVICGCTPVRSKFGWMRF